MRASLLQRRVVIVDNSRTVQAMLDNAFSKRQDFRVVGFANDATTAADIIRRLLPDVVTIDLCMPYIDGAALLEMIRDLPSVCKIVVSDMSSQNLLLTAKLRDAGAAACIAKRDLVDDPDGFFRKINAAVQKMADGKNPRPAVAGACQPLPRAASSVSGVTRVNSFPVPTDESARLAFINRTGLNNPRRERTFDLITKHVAKVTAFPACLLTVIDRDTQWIRSAYGMEVASTPRHQAFCNYTIAQGGAFVVSNAAIDDRFSTNELVTGLPKIRCYAGHPVVSSEGVNIASLCVVDTRIRTVSQHVIDELTGMSALLAEMIDQRAKLIAA